MKSTKSYLICLLLFFAVQLFSEDHYKISFQYLERITDNNFPLPNGISMIFNGSEWSKEFRVGSSCYFGDNPGFDIKFTKKVKYLGNIGIFNRITPTKDIPEYDFSTKLGKDYYVFNMFEAILFGSSISLFNRVHLRTSFDLGAIFEYRGYAKFTPHMRIPLECSVSINKFEPGFGIDGFISKNNEFEITTPIVFLSYNF